MTIFLALLPAYFLSIFYRSFLSVIAQPVMADLAIGPREFGFLGAAWFVAFACAQFPVGWALDRLGPAPHGGHDDGARHGGHLPLRVGHERAGGHARHGADRHRLRARSSWLSLFLFARTTAARPLRGTDLDLHRLGSLGNLVGAAPLAIAAARFGWRPSMLAMACAFGVASLMAAPADQAIRRAPSRPPARPRG